MHILSVGEPQSLQNIAPHSSHSYTRLTFSVQISHSGNVGYSFFFLPFGFLGFFSFGMIIASAIIIIIAEKNQFLNRKMLKRIDF